METLSYEQKLMLNWFNSKFKPIKPESEYSYGGSNGCDAIHDPTMVIDSEFSDKYSEVDLAVVIDILLDISDTWSSIPTIGEI